MSRLIADREGARALAAASYRRAVTGEVSVRRRNELLHRIYQRAQVATTEPLQVEDVAAGGGALVSFSERALADGFADFRRSAPRAATSVLLTDPDL